MIKKGDSRVQGAINEIALEKRIKEWLEEDMPFGDLTTDSIWETEEEGQGNYIAKEEGILCGLDVVKKIYSLIDPKIEVQAFFKDGDRLEEKDKIATVKGPIKSILKGERLGLNLMQRLSSIATESARYAKEVLGTQAVVVDTRKTTPGLRDLEKYAVRVGGCRNHRYSLSDGVMIKDNHAAGAGSITKAIEAIKNKIPHTIRIEVEVENKKELEEALEAGADIIMLDNMSTKAMKEAVEYVRSKSNREVKLEASGNMCLERIKEVALTGVDFISVGALTHSVKAFDISLKFSKI